MSNSRTQRQWLGDLISLFAARGWRDEVGAALAITEASFAARPGELQNAVKKAVPSAFLARNGASRDAVVDAVRSGLAGSIPKQLGEASPIPVTSHLLFVSAHPDDRGPLKVDREFRIIRNELEKTTIGRTVTVDARPATLVEELARYVVEAKPTILHFSGHGGIDGVCVEDAMGQTVSIPGPACRELLQQPAVSARLRVVILNSCLSYAQAHEIVRVVDYVVGMRASVPDDVALAFAQGFYMALGQGLNVVEAFEFGRVAISLSGLSENWMPELFKRPGSAEFVLGSPLTRP